MIRNFPRKPGNDFSYITILEEIEEDNSSKEFNRVWTTRSNSTRPDGISHADAVSGSSSFNDNSIWISI